MEQQEIV
jgi:hypothetical protein